MLTNRSVVTVIILTIITCGIYGWYWVYKTAQELEDAGQSGSGVNPTVTLILCIIFPYVGFLLFGMNADQNLNNIKMRSGRPTTDNKVLYMILGFIIPIVLVGLVQSEINKLAAPAQ